ncbi:MAG TPA: DUF3987 domain-containing protein [Anaerolineales bacterium]|nr:DUF3987 domain-containing protein [Anaerolineales bacterium]
MTTKNEKQSAPAEARAQGTLAKRQNIQNDYTSLEWFAQQGANFVRVAAWNAKVNSPGKQPIDKAWQVKPIAFKDILPHVKKGGNVGLLCGKKSSGLCLLDIDDHLQEFFEYFPGLANAPIIKRADAPDRGKLVLQIKGSIPKNKKWHDVHLEFLGNGNQGVVPPSTHPGGALYELHNADRSALEYDGEKIIRICQLWDDFKNDKKSTDPTPANLSSNERGRVSSQTKDFLEFGAGPHTRNNRLFIAACDLNGCGYSQSEAESFLLPVWSNLGKKEGEAIETIKSAYSQTRTPSNPHAFEKMVKKQGKAAPIISSDVDDENEHPDDAISSAMPELPSFAQMSDAEIKLGKKAGKFIDDYISFAIKDAPMTPHLFHQTYALAILSTAIARRVFVNMGASKSIYPNLYILLSAPSTLYTKTTGYKTALEVMKMAGLSHLLLPDGVTPQSLITELSNRPQDNYQNWNQEEKEEWQNERLFAAQRAWWMDEAASMLSWFQQKHLAELKNIILRFYECESKIKISTIARGRETVRNIYLTICGPTTPAALRQHLKTPEYWSGGLFARFLLVTPDTAPVRVFFPDPFPIPPALVKHINHLMFEKLETPKENALGSTPAPPAIEATLAPGVKRRWDKYHKAMYSLVEKKRIPEKLESSYGRFHEKAIKIAILLATSDWARMAKGNPLVVKDAHWFRAQEITEGYRASLHRMIEDASTPLESEEDELAIRILARLKTSRRNSRREIAIDLHMQTGVKRNQLEMILDQLLKDGILVEKEIKGKRGPSTMRLFPSQG